MYRCVMPTSLSRTLEFVRYRHDGFGRRNVTRERGCSALFADWRLGSVGALNRLIVRLEDRPGFLDLACVVQVQDMDNSTAAALLLCLEQGNAMVVAH